MRTSHKVTHFFVALTALLIFSATTLAQGIFSSTVANIGVSDQKAGSVLVFPYYSSDIDATAALGANTLITITNVCNGSAYINGVRNNSYLHLFFIDGESCGPVDTYVCLTPNASIQILLSEYDPGITGYLVAVAVEADGSPADDINGVDGADTDTIVDDGNCFIGTALVRSTLTPFSGGAYGAEAFRKLTDAAVDAGVGGTAAILLNGTLYDAAPTQFSAQIRTPVIASNNLDQIITLASVSGDLAGGGMSTVTTSGMGVIYRADEATASTPVTLAGTCQVGNEVRAALRPVGPIPPGTNRLYGFLNGTTALGIGTGYGYVKFNTTPAVGLLRITETTVTNATIWSGITTLHKTALGAATLTVPVFPPFCEFF